MFFYDQAGYVNTLDNLLYKQRGGLDSFPSPFGDYYQGGEEQKVSKEYMERVTRETLEAKNKLFQAHMQQMRASQYQMVAQTHSLLSSSYPPAFSTQTPMQDPFQSQVQAFQPSLSQSTSAISSSQVSTMAPQQQPQQPQQQMISTTGYTTLPINNITTTTQHAQQLYQLQHQQIHLQQMQHQLHQRQRAESYIRNKEKLERATQIPYGWQFDPSVRMVHI